MAHVFAGLIIAGLGIWGIASWWPVFGYVMRGVVPITMVLVGTLALLSGLRRRTEASEAKAPARDLGEVRPRGANGASRAMPRN